MLIILLQLNALQLLSIDMDYKESTDQVKRKFITEQDGITRHDNEGEQLPETPTKKKKHSVAAEIMTWSGGKNPVQLLHEKFNEIAYEFQQDGKHFLFLFFFVYNSDRYACIIIFSVTLKII